MPSLRSDLKRILDDREISIRQAAKDIEYRFDSVRQLYNDQMERYPRDLILKLCSYLKITPDKILKYEEEPTE